MIDFTKLPIFQKAEAGPKDKPKHVIINLCPVESTEETRKENYKKIITLLDQLIDLQRESNLPILTVSLGKKEDILDKSQLIEYLEDVLLKKATEHKINITVYGRWYDLSGDLVEALKKINNETKDFDHFFFNLCLNYDGQLEIADACRVIIRKIIMEKSDMDSVNPELIKENIYSKYLLPPDIIIEPSKKFTGTFLWDSQNTKIFNLNKKVLDITKADLIKYFQGSV